MDLAPILILCPMRHRCLVALGVNYESATQNPFAHWSLNHPWPLVILDESHLAKKRLERSLAIRRPVRLPKRHRLAVIGTPMPLSPLDLWAQYRFLDRTLCI